MSEMIINTAKTVRQVVLQQVQAIPEELFDIQPEGFNNTIRWNIGHMIYWMDKYSTLSFASPSALPAEYEKLFNSGTKPSDWRITPPLKEELTQLLKEQLSSLSELKPELLDKNLQSSFEMGPFQFNTAGELFNFCSDSRSHSPWNDIEPAKDSVTLTNESKSPFSWRLINQQ